MSVTLRVLIVPLGISGSLPSGRLAIAASATEKPAGVPPSGEYSAVPSTVCSPLSEVDFHHTLLPSRPKDSSTGAPKVVLPVT